MPDQGPRTVRALRRHNRAAVLRELYLHGPLSRLDLAAGTGLSPATMSNVVGELTTAGVVVEAGAADSDGGRPRVLLRVNPDHAHVVGVDVGETRIRVERFDLGMGERARYVYPLRSAGRDLAEVVDHVLDGIGEVVAGASRPVLGVGIGVPGVVEHATAGALVHGQSIGWDAVPLESMLRSGTDLPLHIDNGAATLAATELWFGAARGARHAVVALLGSGVGAGIITGGRAYRGATSGAGEWGHSVVALGGRSCRCGGRGCLEAYLGAPAVLDRYAQRSGTVPAGTVWAGTDQESRMRALLAAARAGGAAREVVDETVGYLGAGLGTLINLFNPERIVIGGWFGLLLAERHLPDVRAATARHALRTPYRQAEILAADLGATAVALGAATLPVERFLASGALAEPPVGRTRTDRAG